MCVYYCLPGGKYMIFRTVLSPVSVVGGKKNCQDISKKCFQKTQQSCNGNVFHDAKTSAMEVRSFFGENIVNPGETFYCTFIEKCLLNTAKRLQTPHQKCKSGRPRQLIFYQNKTIQSTSALFSEELQLGGFSIN